MIKTLSPLSFLSSFSVPYRALRLLTAIVLSGSLAACAVAPTDSSSSGFIDQAVPKTGLTMAADMYNSRNYPGAIREFDNVISDAGTSANDRRLAHLGKSLVYLGNDTKWHSIDNAKLSLQSAGQVAPEGDDEFSAETDLLMDAVSNVIGTESKYVVLQGKTTGSGAQISELRREIDDLKSENSELLAEQKILHEALEKLKELSLGN